ncbi:MAG: SIR2 family protein [Proteobacteria bacterium]|nr:SIR2 family protein [Pseudomonadota bacterium]
MIVWPTSLIREVAARRCIFFLGAGVSASASDKTGNNPKAWGLFLSEASSLILNNKDKKEVNKLIKWKQYLVALQGIRDRVNPADYRDLLDKHFNNQAYQASYLHECIYLLDSRIVITTNFDRIYEKYCLKTANSDAYKIINYYSHDLVDEIRSDSRLIIKAHGSIDDISKMIFTRSEYHQAKQNHSQFYEIIKALFLTNTVLFVGCSLVDTDVLLLLEEVKITGSSERPHYAVIKKNSMSIFELRDWQKTYNICALEYAPLHDDLLTDLQRLLDQVEIERSTSGI